MKKKIIGILIIILVVFCTFNFVTNVQAIGEETVTLTDGASIRETVDHQGLKFSATLSTVTGVTEYGFYVALGEHDVATMTSAINSSAATVGTNKLVKKTIVGSVDLELNLIIIGFTDTSEAYSNEITVMAYAIMSGTTVLSVTSTTRSIGAVAKMAIDSGNTGTYLDQVYDKYVLFIGFESWAGYIAEDDFHLDDTIYHLHETEVGNWQIRQGAFANSDVISGAQSLQFQYSETNPIAESAYMEYDIDNVSYVTFNAKDTKGCDISLSYSTDGGVSWSTPEEFRLKTTPGAFTYNINGNVGTDNVRLKFDIVLAVFVDHEAGVSVDDIQIFTIAN